MNALIEPEIDFISLCWNDLSTALPLKKVRLSNVVEMSNIDRFRDEWRWK